MADLVWQESYGACPGHLRGTDKRVAVKLRNGMVIKDGWPADGGRHAKTRWTLENHPFDIVEFAEL